MKKYRKTIFCGLLVCSSLCMLALPLGHVNQPKAHNDAIVAVYEETNQNQTESKKTNDNIKEDNTADSAEQSAQSNTNLQPASEEETASQTAAYDPQSQPADNKQETEKSEPVKEEPKEDKKEEAASETNEQKEDEKEADAKKEETSKEEKKEEKEVKDSREAKEKKEDLLAVDPSYTPQRSIISNLTGPIENAEKKENEIDLQKMEEEAQKQAEEEAKASNDGVVRASIHPDFNNLAVWQHPESPYHKNLLWGQCTWFAWHRFYEIYGFNPGFSGNGYETAAQLVASHPDKFTLSSTPKAGAVFSLYNHTGIITNVSDDGLITFQDGNMDYVTNYDWNEAINDWRTQTMPLDQFLASNPGVVFANPNFDVVIE